MITMGQMPRRNVVLIVTEHVGKLFVTARFVKEMVKKLTMWEVTERVDLRTLQLVSWTVTLIGNDNQNGLN